MNIKKRIKKLLFWTHFDIFVTINKHNKNGRRKVYFKQS